MNPIKLVTTAATAPVRAAGAVAGAGLRTSARVIGWTLKQTTGTAPVRTPPPEHTTAVVDHSSPLASTPPVRLVETPSTTEPTKKAVSKKAPAKKAASKKAASKKAPSKKAAVLAPALGLSEAEVVAKDTDPDKG